MTDHDFSEMEKEGKKGGTARAPALQGQFTFEWKYLLWVLLAFLTFVYVVGIFLGSESDQAGVTTSATPTAESTPEVTVKKYKVQRQVGFETERRNDSSIVAGQTQVLSPGQKGLVEITYSVETINGEEQPREEVKRRVIRPASKRIVSKGTGHTTCEDVTSYDYNWDNDMLCTRPDGSQYYTDYAGAARAEGN